MRRILRDAQSGGQAEAGASRAEAQKTLGRPKPA